jgi:hypothetical protein
LLYTTPLPATLQVLRQHALHLLFMPPAPSPGMTTEVQAPIRNIFPFTHKPNTLDRDHILVPAGWDSWGKIGVLRDGFDAKSWNEAWERDLESDGASTEPGAKKLYAALVPDQGAKVCSLPFLSCYWLRGYLNVNVTPSPPHCHPSTTPFQNSPSSPNITTRMRRNQTGTLVALSRIRRIWLQAL